MVAIKKPAFVLMILKAVAGSDQKQGATTDE
jgi:hypothetical protein